MALPLRHFLAEKTTQASDNTQEDIRHVVRPLVPGDPLELDALAAQEDTPRPPADALRVAFLNENDDFRAQNGAFRAQNVQFAADNFQAENFHAHTDTEFCRLASAGIVRQLCLWGEPGTITQFRTRLERVLTSPALRRAVYKVTRCHNPMTASDSTCMCPPPYLTNSPKCCASSSTVIIGMRARTSPIWIV